MVQLDANSFFKYGILCLQKKNTEKAISCFQNALRLNSGNSRTWQCLGDAYLARGSYENAYKAFTKSIEFDDGFTLYSVLKIADIRKILGDYVVASRDYEAILAKEPDCVAALIGLAESKYHIIMDSLSKGLYEKAQTLCAQVLDLSQKASSLRPDLCLPCNIASNCCLVSALNGSQDGSLSQHDGQPLTRGKLIDLGIFWTKKCLLFRKSYRLLHNLGLLLWLRFQETSNSHFLESSFTSILLSLKLNPKASMVWNTIGVVTSSVYPSLSQHFLIHSLKCAMNSEIPWSNLGFLYLIHFENDEDLLYAAHRCFASSQSDNPYFGNAWIGQSIIADSKRNTRALLLFEHSITLGQYSEASLCFAEKVLQLNAFRYFSAAIQTLMLTVRKQPKSVSALTLLGCLLERCGYVEQAASTFAKALDATADSDPSLSSLCAINSLRTNVSANIKLKQDYDGLIESAWSEWKRGEYERAGELYEKCLALPLDPPSKKKALMAYGTILALSGKPGKQHLLQGINIPPVVPSILLTVDAWIEKDMQLFTIMISEMYKLVCRNSIRSRSQYQQLLSLAVISLFIPNNAEFRQLRILNLIHSYPFCGKLHLMEALRLLLFGQKGVDKVLKHIGICKSIENMDIKAIASCHLVTFMAHVRGSKQSKGHGLKSLVKAYHLLPKLEELGQLICEVSKAKDSINKDTLKLVFELILKLILH